MKRIPVHECFYTWQGEGTHLGKAAFFIRTFGCPVQCPWCDSAGTWHPEYVPKTVERFSTQELTRLASESECEFVVITGGEPTVHDLTQLTQDLKAANHKIHLETCGAFEIKGTFDWITLSPKWWKLPLLENLKAAHEFKLIVEDEKSISMWMDIIEKQSLNNRAVWLHPEWSQRENPTVLNAISTWVKEHGAPFRAGLQAHKFYQVDALDKRTAKLAPLGGDEKKGY